MFGQRLSMRRWFTRAGILNCSHGRAEGWHTGVILGVLLSLLQVSAVGDVKIDGLFKEWKTSNLLGTDPVGDSASGDAVDWFALWATYDRQSLCLAYRTFKPIDFETNATAYAVYLDTDSHGETGYRGSQSELAMGGDYLIEGATLYRYAGSGTDWVWTRSADVDHAYRDERLEMCVPGASIGVSARSQIRILLVGANAGIPDYARNDKAGFAYPRHRVVIDGRFNDWSLIKPVGKDIAADVQASDTVDWTSISAVRQQGTLYLRYATQNAVDFTNEAWRYGILIDADDDNRSGYLGLAGGAGAEYLVQGSSLYRYRGAGDDWNWTLVSSLAYALSGHQAELAIDEASLGLAKDDYRIRFRMMGENASVSDYAPDMTPGFVFSSGVKGASKGLSMAIPSYFPPGDLWNQAASAENAVRLMVINPYNGPGAVFDSAYADTVANAQAAGIKVMGYVSTGYSGRPMENVKDDISRYLDWYHVDGIFLDEVSVFCSVIDYYREADGIIRSHPKLMTVLNNGNYPGECYMSVGDIVVYEQTYSTFKKVRPPKWMTGYPASRFWNIVWNTREGQLENALAIARQRNVGFLYVTDDGLSNPYDSLPSYWEREVDGLK